MAVQQYKKHLNIISFFHFERLYNTFAKEKWVTALYVELIVKKVTLIHLNCSNSTC